MRQLHLQFQYSDSAVAQLQGTMLDSSQVNQIVDADSTTVYTPNGEILAIFLKKIIPQPLCTAAEPIFLKAASEKVIGSFRGTASGTKMAHRIKKDGTVSKMLAVPDVPRLQGAKNGVLGYLDRSNLNPCRTTSYTRDHWADFSTTVMPYVQAVDQVFQTYMPERWAAQMAVARTTPAHTITGTSLSTITVNLNFATAVHKDAGDLRQGFGIVSCFRAGCFTGGTLVFPQYGVGFDIGTEDVLLCDVHRWHGNLPIIGEPGAYQRLSCVFYFREKLTQCR